MLDLHRHDECSFFDGFGKPSELVKIAKDLGHTSIGISNHGNIDSAVEHWLACRHMGLKPILGIEAYFQPKFNTEKPKYHLCLFAKDLEGYRNLNRIIYLSNKNYFYYKPTVTFELLEKYHKGIICTSACIGGIIQHFLAKGKIDRATRLAERFQNIFEDDYYLEIQPYTLTGEDTELQERANFLTMELGEELDIECILTSDSHFGSKEDFDTYLKLHAIGKHEELGKQYSERYIPSEKELRNRFIEMHGEGKYKIRKPKAMARKMIENLQEIEDKVDGEILDKLEMCLPVYDENQDSDRLLWKKIKQGLKLRGKFDNEEYLHRCKVEFDVIKHHGFSDYFLIVQDYVQYAKDIGIKIGTGRGSVCNSLVAYILGVTEVDSIYFKLDFDRFLRKDKKKFPDIDIDFETDRRNEVIAYLVKRYKGNAAQICSYGAYKIDNTLNDLFKVCGVDDKSTMKEIKAFVNSKCEGEAKDFDYSKVKTDAMCRYYDKEYDNIVKHFSKLYKKFRYIGTHAAGVAISGRSILDSTAVEKRSNNMSTAFDLNNLEHINVMKFDMLGLRTLSSLLSLEEQTGKVFDYSWLDDEKIYEQFALGNTDGIFQFEKGGVKDMLIAMEVDSIEDIIAANAMNRPGPLAMGTPKQYVHNKKNLKDAKKSAYYKYTKDTHGTIVYQEQVTAIAKSMGKMTADEADLVMKMIKSSSIKNSIVKEKNDESVDVVAGLRKSFVTGAVSQGIKKSEAEKVFAAIMTYSFNKGHASAYGLLAVNEMYYKLYYPLEFWQAKMKYTQIEADVNRYMEKAVAQGCVILLPHVNGSAEFEVTEVDGERCIRQGTSNLKGVGGKASQAIEEERRKGGDFESLDDFMLRIYPIKRIVNKRVLETLEEGGALVFDEKVYFQRCAKLNSALYQRGRRFS